MGLALRPRIAPPPVHPAMTRSPADSVVRFLAPPRSAVSSRFHGVHKAGPTRFRCLPLTWVRPSRPTAGGLFRHSRDNTTGRNSSYRVPAGIARGQTVRDIAADGARGPVLSLSVFEHWGDRPAPLFDPEDSMGCMLAPTSATGVPARIVLQRTVTRAAPYFTALRPDVTSIAHLVGAAVPLGTSRGSSHFVRASPVTASGPDFTGTGWSVMDARPSVTPVAPHISPPARMISATMRCSFAIRSMVTCLRPGTAAPEWLCDCPRRNFPPEELHSK